MLVLITDLFEGGDNQDMRKRAKALTEAGVQLVVLLALNDEVLLPTTTATQSHGFSWDTRIRLHAG